MQSVVNGVAYNCGKQFGARSLGPRTHAAQRQRHQRRRNAARDSPVIGTALQTHGGAKKPRPQHVENQEGSGCVLGTCLTAIIDGVWQHDVKYMCKYSTTSFIDHFTTTEHARSNCRRPAAGIKSAERLPNTNIVSKQTRKNASNSGVIMDSNSSQEQKSRTQ